MRMPKLVSVLLHQVIRYAVHSLLLPTTTHLEPRLAEAGGTGEAQAMPNARQPLLGTASRDVTITSCTTTRCQYQLQEISKV